MCPTCPLLALLRLVLCVALLGLGWGCQSVPTGSNLIRLTGYSPKSLGISDELEIQGDGFPEGRTARVALRGDLFRPGNRVERDVEIVARTNSSSPRSLSIAMTEGLRAALTGSGDAAKHTTFRGDIEVSFTPKKTGSAPVVGTLSDVVLDVEPPLVSETLQRQRDEDAASALAFFGLTLRGNDFGDCCVVGAADGRIQAIGLAPGDKIVDLDGVTVQSPYDLVPSGRSRVVRLTYHRAGSGPLITRELDVQGYRSAAPSELGSAVGIVGCLVFWLLLTQTRLGAPLTWTKRWLAVRLREASSTSLPELRQQWKHRKCNWPSAIGLPSEAGWSLFALMLLGAQSTLGTLVGLHVDLFSAELDLVLWLIFHVVSATWAALLGQFSFSARASLGAVKAALQSLMIQLPLIILTGTAIVAARSLRIPDLVHEQQNALFSCYCLKNPPLLLLSLLAVVALIPELTEPDPSPSARGRWLGLTHGLGRLLSGTVYLWSAALLISLLCLGGYHVPWIGDSLQRHSYGWQIVGVALWFTKSAGMVLVVAALRQIAGATSLGDVFVPWFKVGLSLAGIGALAFAVWSALIRRYALGWLEESTAWVMLLMTLSAAVWVVAGAFRLARMSRNELAPNVWL